MIRLCINIPIMNEIFFVFVVFIKLLNGKKLVNELELNLMSEEY